MVEPLNSFELNQLLGFIGYGNPEGLVWFLGMEPDDRGDIRGRLSFERVEDLKSVREKLGMPLPGKGNGAEQTVWWGMARMMLCLQGKNDSEANVRAYLEQALGTRDGDALLLYLMPLPRSEEVEWGPGGVIPQFRSQGAYLETVLPARIRYLRAFIANHRPKAILAYGKSARVHYKKLFSGGTFTPENSFEMGEDLGALLLLMPHLASNDGSNGWEDVVGVLLERLELE